MKESFKKYFAKTFGSRTFLLITMFSFVYLWGNKTLINETESGKIRLIALIAIITISFFGVCLMAGKIVLEKIKLSYEKK